MAQALARLALWLCLAVSVVHAAPVDRCSSPSWVQLSAEQRRILAPIEAEWGKLDPLRKRKWLGIAQRYPTLAPDEQERLQRRMKDWAALTPQQRRAARETYREFEQLPVPERRAVRKKWEEYRSRAEPKPEPQATPAESPEPPVDSGAAGAPPQGAAGLKP